MRGLKDLADTLAALEPTVYRKAAKEAMSDATKLILTSAKAKVPARTKSLRKALGRKVKALKSGTGYYGVVGPRKDSKKKIAASEAAVKAGTRKTAIRSRFKRTVKHQGRELLVNPVKYAHLVEFGRGPARPKEKKAMSDGVNIYGRRTKSVAPQPFMRPAWDENAAKTASIVKDKMREASKEASRTRKGAR